MPGRPSSFLTPVWRAAPDLESFSTASRSASSRPAPTIPRGSSPWRSRYTLSPLVRLLLFPQLQSVTRNPFFLISAIRLERSFHRHLLGLHVRR